MWALLFAGFVISISASKCSPKVYEGAFRNQVCVCNATFCDQIEPLGSIPTGQAAVYRSSQAGDRLEKSFIKAGKVAGTPDVKIIVDARQKNQEIIGFGGAFTDAAGINLAALHPSIANTLLEAYFGENGLEYNLGRVPIASCDFSTREYSYDEVKGDFSLEHFNLTREDFDYKIPYILAANEISSRSLQLFSSPWSAPGWMKTTGRMKGGGQMINDSRIHSTYANYFVRFFEEYRKAGVKFWATTIQNEPSTGADLDWRWQTMNFTAQTSRDFLRDHLGPALKGNKLTKDLKVMILDDSRGLLPGWADTIFNDPVAGNFADGVGVHWYGNLYSPASLLSRTFERHPDKFILATEACAGYAGQHGPILGDWFRAEAYADDIIADLNNFVSGWVDWNLALDETGGPNWVFNVVDSPIIVNKTAQEFYKEPMYYALGHFSKFFPRGSSRISVKSEGSLGVVATGVVKNGRRSVVILNKTSQEYRTDIIDAVTLEMFSIVIPARSIHTVVWDKTNLN